MNPIKHTTAKASYYDSQAECYDAFNESNSKKTNALLEQILKQYGVTTVLDLTCGTGSQVFWLKDAGFDVVGSDINALMLNIAQEKAKEKNAEIQFLKGDCRNIHVGEFDAVITIFNAIGHLTREDFDQTIQNVKLNLKANGIYVFDIFNLDYLTYQNNISRLTIDWMTVLNGRNVREIQFSTITDDGVLASYSTYIPHDEYVSDAAPGSKGYTNTLQVYSAHELKEILQKSGFIVLDQIGINGEPFLELETERILTIAQKMKTP